MVVGRKWLDQHGFGRRRVSARSRAKARPASALKQATFPADVSSVKPHIGTLDFARNPTARASRKPWLEHWLETCRDLSDLRATHPMMDAVIDEIDGRMIRIGDKWLADFASCNYLGFDLDREIIDAVPGYLDAWGTHPSWSRLLGSPVLYEEIEERLTALLGCEDSLVLPTITHIHMSVIPLLAASARSSSTRAHTRRSTTAARWRARAVLRSGASASRIRTTSTSCCATRQTARGSCAWTA